MAPLGVLAALVVLAAGCGRPAPGVAVRASAGGGAAAPVSATATTIGPLDAPNIPDAPHVPPGAVLPPVDQDSWEVSCAQFRTLTGHDPYYPTDLPSSAGRPLCEISPAAGPQSRSVGGHYEGGVLYVPAGLSSTANSFDEVWDAGGILIDELFNRPASEPLWSSTNPPPQAGATTGPGPRPSEVRTTIRRGKPTTVAHNDGNMVMVRWNEADDTGSMMGFLVMADYGHYSPDELYQIAQSLVPGIPPDELPVPSTPPPTAQPGTPAPSQPTNPPNAVPAPTYPQHIYYTGGATSTTAPPSSTTSAPPPSTTSTAGG